MKAVGATQNLAKDKKGPKGNVYPTLYASIRGFFEVVLLSSSAAAASSTAAAGSILRVPGMD